MSTGFQDVGGIFFRRYEDIRGVSFHSIVSAKRIRCRGTAARSPSFIAVSHASVTTDTA